MKFKLLTMLFIAAACNLFAQSKHQKAIQRSLTNKSVEISLDTVFYSGEAWFTISDKAGGNALVKVKEIKTLTGKTAATITKAFNGTYGMSSTFYIEFPAITGQAAITKSGMEGCVTYLFANKVFKNKDLDVEEAKKFMSANAYVAPVYQETPETNTSNTYNSSNSYSQNNPPVQSNSPKTSATNTQNQPPASVNASFTIKNNGSKTVKYFIGTKPKYGSGRTSSIGGNTRTSEHGSVGDQLCIVDDSDNPISCMTISSSMSTVYISSNGTGFGDN